VAIGLKRTTWVSRIADCIGFFTKISNSLLINSTSSDVEIDANHENMSLFIVLGALRFLEEDDDFGFVILALLAFRCLRGGLREAALLRLPPRNFLIILCVVSVACWDSMWPVCEGMSVISVMIFPPVRNALRPRDVALLHSTGRTVLHSPRRKLPIPCPRCMNGGTE